MYDLENLYKQLVELKEKKNVKLDRIVNFNVEKLSVREKVKLFAKGRTEYLKEWLEKQFYNNFYCIFTFKITIRTWRKEVIKYSLQMLINVLLLGIDCYWL